MYANQMVHQIYSEPNYYQLIKSSNSLGIHRIDLIKDRQRNHLIFFLESDRAISREFQVLIKGPSLTLEAAIEPDFNKPLRTHLLKSKHNQKYGYDDLVIGFSEIRLNPGYQYSLVSSGVISPGLIKIILRYSTKRNNKMYRVE